MGGPLLVVHNFLCHHRKAQEKANEEYHQQYAKENEIEPQQDKTKQVYAQQMGGNGNYARRHHKGEITWIKIGNTFPQGHQFEDKYSCRRSEEHTSELQSREN